MKRISEKFLAIVLAVCIIGAVMVPIGAALTSVAAGESDPAYELDFSACTNDAGNVRLVGGANRTGAIDISFDYYVPSTGKVHVKNYSGTKAEYGTLTNGVRSKFAKTINNDGGFILGINQEATGNTGGKVYIWNLTVKFDGADITIKTSAQSSAKVKAITVADLPSAPVALDNQDRNTKVIKLTGTTANAFFANRYMDMSNGSHTYGISFDYYLASGAAGVRDLENNANVSDSVLKSASLADGVHRFEGTYTKDAYSVRLGIQQTSGAKLELYVANMVVTRDGVKVTRAEDIMVGLSREDVTVGDVAFPGTVNALKVSATDDSATAVVLYQNDSALADSDVIDISFKYLVSGKTDKAIVVNNPGDGAAKLGDLDTDAVLEYHKKLSKADLGDGAVKIAAQLEKGAEGDLYIWDLKIKDGTGKWLEYPTVTEAAANAASDKVTTVVYDDIPVPTPIYHLVTNVPYTSLHDTSVQTSAGTYRVKFEYYMANDNFVEVGESIEWMGIKDGVAKRSALLQGHHFFDGTVEIKKNRSIVFAVMSRDNLDTDVYVKDFRIYQIKEDGTEVRLDNSTMEIYHPDVKDDKGAITEEHYTEDAPTVPHFPQDEQGDDPGSDEPQEIPVENQLMLVQENGKLEYNQLFQWIGMDYSGHEVKEGDRYKFSFDYYCEPDDKDLGVATKLLGVIRWPSDANHKDSTAFDAAGNLLRNEDGDYYDPLLNPKAGKHKFSQEFTVPAECDRFLVGIQTTDSDGAGKVYYWNFSVIDLETGKELLTRGVFENPLDTAWSRYISGEGIGEGKMGRWGVSKDSNDGHGAYYFVPYDATKAASQETDPGESGGGGTTDDPFADDGDGDDEDIDLNQGEANFDNNDDGDDYGDDYGDDGEGEYIYIPGDETTAESGGVDVIETTVYRTRKRTAIFENPMDMFWLIVAIVEAVLLVGCIATGTILIIKKKNRQ
ncbi:MAG: hypothetical protein MJ132_07750 [Clostridia bacterium]|nr:hypothetical protein [Clostridia bacterium]